MSEIVDGVLVREIFTAEWSLRHWDCVGPSDVIKEYDPGPDTLPTGEIITPICRMCWKPIALIE